MSDFEDAATGSGDPTAAAKRIGNGEREAAVSALKVHHADGRLDSREYEDRALQARAARTWADLDPLFVDLPEPRPVPGAVPPQLPPQLPTQLPPAQAPASLPGTVGPAASPSGSAPAPYQRTSLLPEPWAAWVMSLTPFAALIIFLITDDWEWFLAIPIAGIVIYGPDGHHADRNRNRDRRRR
jgi:hypothetical protein